MSSTPGALEIVRDAFDRMRTAVPVAPPTREERTAAWGRLKESLVGWSVPTDDAAFTGFDPAKPGSEQSFVFRTKLPEATWRELAPPPAVEIVKLRGQIAKLTEAYDVRGQALRETYEERDRALAKGIIYLTPREVEMLLIPSFLGLSKIDGAGIGLFAGRAISKGEIIWQFDERVDWLMASTVVDRLPQSGREFVYHYGCQIQDDLWLLSGDNARFVNHSVPGVIAADLIGHIDAKESALRDIEFGEEITEDYGRISLDFQRRGFYGGSP